MARPPYVELDSGKRSIRIPILYEDRSVIALDKPPGWLLIPFSWQSTQRNLQAAITSSIAAGDFWARSRNLRHLRHVHRLDGDTSGILLMAKSPGAGNAYSDLFESRRMSKTYLAVVHGVPREASWTSRTPISQDKGMIGRMKLDPKDGKDAETAFKVLRTLGDRTLIEARPLTGRTHQIRIHLLEAGCPVVGDEIYGPVPGTPQAKTSVRSLHFPLALRAVRLEYVDPFQKKKVWIAAPQETFLREYGFGPEVAPNAAVAAPITVQSPPTATPSATAPQLRAQPQPPTPASSPASVRVSTGRGRAPSSAEASTSKPASSRTPHADRERPFRSRQQGKR